MKNLRLKAARAALDLSQQELAERVGVSRQTINAIEKGDYNPHHQPLSEDLPRAGQNAGRLILGAGRGGSAASQCRWLEVDAPKPHEQGAWALRFVPNGATVRADGGRPTSRGCPPAAFFGGRGRRFVSPLCSGDVFFKKRFFHG